MKLTHLGISHFRSIGTKPVMIDLTKKITILVGQNDCGKSNVLRGVERVCSWKLDTDVNDPESIDCHQRKNSQYPRVHLKGVSNRESEEHLKQFSEISIHTRLGRLYDGATNSEELLQMERDRFISFAKHYNVASAHFSPQEEEVLRMKSTVAQIFCTELSNGRPKLQIVPQFRRIEDGSQYTIDGKGIIKLLANWQNPPDGKYDQRQKFDQVEQLLCKLLERPNVKLDVPRSEKLIMVHDTKSGLRLPLESHGTGIHQLIILAIAVLSEDDALYGIEEPEIHLHPVLQKRFLKFLREETTGRYIITTHSPVLIAPAEDVDVIHLKMVDGVTIPRRIETDVGTLEALEDLGIRPSDLLQANSVIWVEGPSDRVYIKRWLELLAPDLTEGIDYSIMFYGGRLLSHLSADREVDALVKLLRINQRSAVVMDSDRKKSGDELNDTKKRIIVECKQSGMHSWVTRGREIENYLTQRVVEAVLEQEKQPLQDRFKLTDVGIFGDLFARMVGKNAPSRFDYDSHKPAWAHRFAAEMKLTDLPLDLRDEVGWLAEFIRRRKPES